MSTNKSNISVSPHCLTTITKSRYEELLRAEAELNALHAGGVDNWEWYHESLQDAGLLDDDEDEDDE